MNIFIELFIFCIIWMLLGTYVIDIRKYCSTEIFCNIDSNIALLLYGITLFFVSKLLQICIKKVYDKIK